MVSASPAWHKRAIASGGDLDDGTRILTGLPLRLVQLACVLLIAVKVAHWSLSGVFMDEAYYWLWGQHPALSYYDHPPLNAWLLGLSSTVFGWSKLALRAPVIVAFAADILALWLIARRIGGDWRGHFWVSMLLFLATPVFAMVTNYALPDHLLLTGLLFAVYFFFRFLADRAEGGEGATRDLLLGALFLGLAGLAKYNAAFLGLGVAAYVVFRDQALLWQGRLYLAALLALAIQTPVIVWNAGERFASYGFILEGRHAGIEATIDGMFPLLLNFGVFVSPILLWPLLSFALGKNRIPGIGFARATFGLSSVAIIAIAFATVTLFHWNLPAYAAVLPFLAVYMRPAILLPLQALWGLAFAVLLFMAYVTNPLLAVNTWRDQSVPWAMDWTPIAEAVIAARAEHEVGFVAAPTYMTASPLAFALRDRDVVSLANKRDQFDYWFDPQAHAGEDAILYTDSFQPLTGELSDQFESVTPLASHAVVVDGQTINGQTIYLAKGFTPRE